jgi:Icc protein
MCYSFGGLNRNSALLPHCSGFPHCRGVGYNPRMKRIAWLTDLHLNFLDEKGVGKFVSSLAATKADAFLVGGDTGEARDVALHLNTLDTALARPIYFVLGNHDYYGGTIAGVRAKVEALCAACPNLKWLSRSGVITLTELTCLVGHDGWGDGRIGDYDRSSVELNDWQLIGELSGLGKSNRLARLKALGDEAAAHFRAVLPEALERFRHVIVLTHVPPFREACWHEGRISDDDWLPHFTCKAAGDTLCEAMAARPDRQMMVLCGHTHSPGEAPILANLRVLTGGAVYGEPKVQRVLDVS